MAAHLSGASRLLEGWKAGHALRATVGALALPTALPLGGFDSEAVVRLGGLQRDELLRGSPEIDRDFRDLTLALQPFSEDRFGEIVSVPDDLWNTVAAEAAERLRQNVDRRLTNDRAEALLRGGYALRALEEALSLPPSIPAAG